MLENKFYNKIQKYNYKQLMFVRTYMYHKLNKDQKDILNYFIGEKQSEEG